MKLKYTMDISEKSVWFVNTPNEISKRLPFYITEYGHYIAQSSYFTERQKLKSYLFIYTLSGKGYLKYLDKEYVLGPQQVVLLSCDPYHLYKTYQGGNWEFKWFHFNGTSAKEHFNLLNQDALNIVAISDPPAFQKMIDELFSSFGVNDMTANVKASMMATNIISYLIINRLASVKNKKHAEHRSDIEKAILYIQNNYHDRLDMEDLARAACMSKYYFIRLFKIHTGTSPYGFVLNYRINKAKELLKTTEHSIGEICTLVGFVDYNNFIREFKKVVGTTPLKYRLTN